MNPIKRVAPLLLLIWLVVMVILGWPSYKAGLTSPALYFGGSGVCLLCIVGLYFHFKRQKPRRRQ